MTYRIILLTFQLFFYVVRIFCSYISINISVYQKRFFNFDSIMNLPKRVPSFRVKTINRVQTSCSRSNVFGQSLKIIFKHCLFTGIYYTNVCIPIF